MSGARQALRNMENANPGVGNTPGWQEQARQASSTGSGGAVRQSPSAQSAAREVMQKVESDNPGAGMGPRIKTVAGMGLVRGVKQVLGGAAERMLDPGGLADEVAARAARDNEHQQFIDRANAEGQKIPNSPMRRPRGTVA